MKLLTCSLLIALLIIPPAFAADDKLASGTASLYHLASILGIEIPLEQVENIVVQKAQVSYVVKFVIIGAASQIGIELREHNLNYKALQALETPVIACLKTALDDNDSETDATVISDFIVVESATEKAVRVLGAPRKSSRAAATFISRDHFLEHWTGQVLIPSPLSVEATQLLEDIITGTAAYNAKLKSGEVEFSITLSERIREKKKNFFERFLTWGGNLLMPPENKKEEVQYEDQGYWHITYRFDGDRHFYNVKARKKMELNGALLPNWKEIHHQYRMLGKTLHFRANTDTAWKRHPPTPSGTFEEEFNPRWWSWPPWGFKLEKLIRIFKPINVQQVNVEGIPHNFLTLQRADPRTTRTFEIWLNPQKEYRSTRILTHRKSIIKLFERRPDGKIIPLPPEKEYRLTRYIYQLAQFEPDIWFPKTAIMEQSSVVGDEDKKLPPAYRRTTMQVHRAVFNIPISEEALGITSDR